LKKLIIDREHPNGIVADMTAAEITEMQKNAVAVPYEQRVVDRIRSVYTIDDELAILRQRDTKPEEFAEYNAFVERIKAEERAKD
jgi:hypothetical protein